MLALLWPGRLAGSRQARSSEVPWAMAAITALRKPAPHESPKK
jgi:hypothetical protein